MIRLITHITSAYDILNSLSIDKASKLAAHMCVTGYGIDSDRLQFYSATDQYGTVCGAFVVCNGRVFCLIEHLYDEEEISIFLNGFSDLKIFIKQSFSHIIKRSTSYSCCLMKTSKQISLQNMDEIPQPDSKHFASVISENKTKEEFIKFLLFNSYLQRHNFLRNFADSSDENHMNTVASLYFHEECAYLCNVYTLEAHRNQGYSLNLLNKIYNSHHQIHLICNENVSPLYKKCGFETYCKWIEFLT